MRSSRVLFVLATGWAAVTLATSACSPLPDEQLVASDPSLVVVDDDGADTASLRAPDDESSRAGAGTAAPGPPTLSPAGAAVQSTPSTAPATTASSTTAPAVATSATTASTAPASTDTTAPTGTSSDGAPSPGGGDASVTTAGQPGTSSSAPAGSPAADLAPGEDRSSALLNELRSGLDLTALAREAEMDTFARDWSRHMAETGEFAHSDGPYGENIAFTSNRGLSAAEAAELFHQLWIDSSGHYRNMTNDRYTKVGIGLYLTDRGWYGTHVFQY
jgi:uncharacterized protein YkwD